MISAHSTTRPLLLHFTNKPLLKKTMKSLIIVLLTVVGALGTRLRSLDLDEEWKAWMDFHGKEYNNMAEEMERRLIWEDNLRTITKHNLEHSRGEKTYRLGMNAFGDMTNAEFVATRTMKMNKGPSKVRHGSTFLPSEYLQLPDAVDWRTKGYVTPVKDQGQCGSCWAFSTVGALEGQHFAKTGNLVSLSEQNLVDCAQAEGDMGCEGGWPSWADEYIKKNGGIDTEAGYPYTGEDGTCHFSTSDIGATLTGFVEITTDSEKSLEKALAQIGPISVCIDASQESFQLYESGVYNEPDCSSTLLDHCVTAVGYDVTSDGDKYYIVKNSWGTTWGQEGYIWMSRDNHNQCGIATNATYPLV